MNRFAIFLTKVKEFLLRSAYAIKTNFPKVLNWLTKFSGSIFAIGLALYLIGTLGLNIIAASKAEKLEKTLAEQQNLLHAMDIVINERIIESEKHLEHLITTKFIELQGIIAELPEEPPVEEPEISIPTYPSTYGTSFTNSSRPVMTLSSQDLYLIESIVAGESGNQPYLGMQAVAQCLMNAMLKDGYTAKQVQVNYQYSGYHDINNFISANPTSGQMVKDAVASVFFHQQVVTNANILWFCNPKLVSPNTFHFSQNRIMDIDDHAFFAPWN